MLLCTGRSLAEHADREFLMMKRRQFLALLSGATAAPALLLACAARAQQGERVRRVGITRPAAADDARFQTWVGAFLQGPALFGWTIGRNVGNDIHWAGA